MSGMNEQLSFRFKTHGGRRNGAGRPRRLRRVPHRPRPTHRKSYPLHVTLRADSLPPFREQALFRVIREALRMASRSPAVGEAFRVLHFSVQTDHIHLIVEAHNSSVRSRGMQGLAIRVARAVNRLLRIRGNVWRERYHAHTLRTPREVRNAIVYVLMNAKKHRRPVIGLDRFSSARWFDGILGHTRAEEENTCVASPRTREDENTCVASPRTWLAGVGWRRYGLIHPHEAPRTI